MQGSCVDALVCMEGTKDQPHSGLEAACGADLRCQPLERTRGFFFFSWQAWSCRRVVEIARRERARELYIEGSSLTA